MLSVSYRRGEKPRELAVRVAARRAHPASQDTPASLGRERIAHAAPAGEKTKRREVTRELDVIAPERSEVTRELDPVARHRARLPGSARPLRERPG